MATETTNYKLQKPDTNDYVAIGTLNGNMDIVDRALYGHEERLKTLEGAEIFIPPDFNNPLCWPGCTRVTLPEDKETKTTIEKWVDTATKNILKAQRTTVENEDGSYLETYEFYSEDGGTLESKFTVLTSQDGETETYYEEVTEVVE